MSRHGSAAEPDSVPYAAFRAAAEAAYEHGVDAAAARAIAHAFADVMLPAERERAEAEKAVAVGEALQEAATAVEDGEVGLSKRARAEVSMWLAVRSARATAAGRAATTATGALWQLVNESAANAA